MIMNLQNINPEEGKFWFRFLTGFMITSFIIFIIGVALSTYYIFVYPRSRGSVYGTITEINNKGTTIQYRVNDAPYIKTYSVHSSNYFVGKDVKILYNKARPYRSSIANFRYLWLIAPGIGIIFLGVSGILLFVFYKQKSIQ